MEEGFSVLESPGDYWAVETNTDTTEPAPPMYQALYLWLVIAILVTGLKAEGLGSRVIDEK